MNAKLKLKKKYFISVCVYICVYASVFVFESNLFGPYRTASYTLHMIDIYHVTLFNDIYINNNDITNEIIVQIIIKLI